MPIGTGSVNVTQIKAETGATDNNISALNTSSLLNLWSFYKPCKLIRNAGTRLFERETDTAPYKEGDFRGYNQSAQSPNITSSNPQTPAYVPGAPDVSFSVSVDHEETNLKELITTVGDDITHLWLKVYSDAGRTSLVGSGSAAITFNANTPPVGHTNNQTERPAGSTLVSATITSPVDGAHYYADVYYSNAGGGTVFAKFSANTTDVYPHEYQQPTITPQTFSWTPSPLYSSTGIAPSATAVIPYNTINSNVAGDTSWNFSFQVQAIFLGGTPPTTDVAGDVQIAYEYPFLSGTYVNIGGLRAFTNGSTISITDAISGGLTQVDYDQDIVIRCIFTSCVVSTPVV